MVVVVVVVVAVVVVVVVAPISDEVDEVKMLLLGAKMDESEDKDEYEHEE